MRNPANVSASEMMKIHIMNLLHVVPKGDFPPPQSEASIRCCSAKVASIYYSQRRLGQHKQDEQIYPERVHEVPVGCAKLQRLVFPGDDLISHGFLEQIS